MGSPLVTFEEARLNHLRDGIAASFAEKMAWLEAACDLAETIRRNRFAKGEPVMDQTGRISWNEEEFLGIPREEERAANS